jgi:acylphosphatase
MNEMAGIRATVRGRVQGVFFRDSTRRYAEQAGLTGFSRNMPDPTAVEVVAEGDRTRLEALVEFLKRGPPAARVDSVETERSVYSGTFVDFTIRY